MPSAVRISCSCPRWRASPAAANNSSESAQERTKLWMRWTTRGLSKICMHYWRPSESVVVLAPSTLQGIKYGMNAVGLGVQTDPTHRPFLRKPQSGNKRCKCRWSIFLSDLKKFVFSEDKRAIQYSIWSRHRGLSVDCWLPLAEGPQQPLGVQQWAGPRKWHSAAARHFGGEKGEVSWHVWLQWSLFKWWTVTRS